MFPQQHFRLTGQAAILAIVSAAFPLTGYCAAAGRADFVIGNVVAVAPDGSQRTLAKGAEVNVGDAINTAAGARAQIRFTDGGYVSLQPNSLFRVDDYHYENKTDGKEKGFFSLLKGGLRTITGVIGHVNRDTYKVVTPLATIGIRGTGYNAVLNDHLTVSVADGIISLTNKGGTLILSQGQSALVKDINTIPSLTFEKPATPPVSLTGTTMPLIKTEQYVQGDCVGACGSSGGALPVQGQGGITFFSTNAANGNSLGFSDTVSYTSDMGLSTFTSTTGGYRGTRGTATVVDYLLNGYPLVGTETMNWGRWSGTGATVTSPSGVTAPVFNLHYVGGSPVPQMPVTGTATYLPVGGTRPTDSTGNIVGQFNVSGSMVQVDFAAASLTVGINLSANGVAYAANGTGNYSTNGLIPVAPLTVSCVPACASATGDFAGAFVGTNAAGLGLVYHVKQNLGVDIAGAQGFIRH